MSQIIDAVTRWIDSDLQPLGKHAREDAALCALIRQNDPHADRW